METAVWVWLALAFIFLMIEIFSPGFIFACFVVGSLGGALAAVFTPESYLLQGVVFAVVSLILIPLSRPLANKITKPSPIKSNIDGLIGKVGYVKAEVTDTAGQVIVENQTWQARAKNTIAADKKISVTAIEGTTMKVEEIE
ncbi:MAG: NfeD family protein [FCB group bacterium]|nr:NfeD family protein [FCB group bacterium]